MIPDPVQALAALALGTRVVVRHRVAGGLTDALGYLRELSTVQCVVETRRGTVTIYLADVFAAKQVPQQPPRRRSG